MVRSNAKKQKKKQKRIPIHFEVTEDVRDKLDALQEKWGASSLTEAFRRSLALSDHILDEVLLGAKIKAERDGSEREILVL